MKIIRQLVPTVAFLVLILCPLSYGAEFGSETLEKTTSISNAYESRSLFTNPAALGYQTELNGAPLLSSFTYGLNQGTDNEFSTSLALGYFGLGAERLADPNGNGMFTRYDLGVGIPLTTKWYFGTRYRFTRSDALALDHVNSWDFGFQWRPSEKISFGLMGVGVNTPQVAGTTVPAQLVLGTTVRPIPKIELSADVGTYSSSFAKVFSYQVTASYEVASGLQVRAAYQRDEKFLFGFQLNFDRASVYSVGQPAANQQSLMAGIQLSTKPYKSFLTPDSALKVEVSDNLHETSSPGGLFRTERPSLLGLLRKLERARRDPSIKLVAIKMQQFPLGMASAQEVHQAILRLKESGKRVEVFLGNAGIKEYLIACAATKVFVEPSAELRFLGLRSERYYVKGTLDKLGVEGQFLARGKYKSAPEMFTRTDSSAPSKEETMEELAQAETIISDTLFKTRHISRTQWETLLRTALLDANQAKTAGLVDEINHMDVALKSEPLAIRETLEMTSDKLALPPRIAVIVASGDILQKKISVLSLVGEPQITPDRMRQHFREALADPRTEAIVFRVSSPGGEVVASDEIASLVRAADKEGKPVIVTMGDVAASGGYLISAPARQIFADPLTITGSIGVFLGKFNLGELYKKIDLHKEILTQAPFAGLLTEDRSWTKEEREILAKRLNQYYEGFVKFVAQERKLSLDHVEDVAQGRVWLGSEAFKQHLTDAEGGYYEAIQYAARQVGRTPEEIETHMIQDPRGLLEFFSPEDVFGRDPLTSLAGEVFSPNLLDEIRWMSRVRESPFLYLSPVRSLE